MTSAVFVVAGRYLFGVLLVELLITRGLCAREVRRVSKVR